MALAHGLRHGLRFSSGISSKESRSSTVANWRSCSYMLSLRNLVEAKSFTRLLPASPLACICLRINWMMRHAERRLAEYVRRDVAGKPHRCA